MASRDCSSTDQRYLQISPFARSLDNWSRTPSASVVKDAKLDAMNPALSVTTISGNYRGQTLAFSSLSAIRTRSGRDAAFIFRMTWPR